MATPTVLQGVFWGSLLLLACAYAGYPLLIAALARTRGKSPPLAESQERPPVSVVLCVHNEASRIARRLANLRATDYPADRLEIIVISDGSTDDTVAAAQATNTRDLQVIELAERRGKPAALNTGIAAARGEVVVLADARQEFASDTIPHLVRHFADPSVGAVSGALEIAPAASGVAGGVDAYWRIERALRAAEARWDSCIGCTGAVYALRRELFEPLPEDTLIDDVVVPMRIAVRGKRVLFDPAAIAHDPQTLEPERESIRKQRTLAGNFQMLFRHPGWLLPWRNRLWWQLAAHKYLRLAGPPLLLALFATNAALLDLPAYRWLFWGQCAFHGCALLGLAFRRLRLPVFTLPAGFVFLNLMIVSGLWYYLRGSHRHGWKRAAS
jgi:cellulose synthase/poly-beta-1,6-N-acetylglucosamine synthase-like glycosyltransferase